MTPPPTISVLLVDDLPQNLLALEALLAPLELNIVTARSGHEALKQLLEHDFGVILLDVQMPDMSGFELAELVRTRDRSQETPIIFISAIDTTQEAIRRGYALGAVDYIVKPIVPEILQTKVSIFVELCRKQKQLERQAADLRRITHQHELILQAMSEGLFALNGQGRIVVANEAAERMTGWSAAELEQQDIHSLIHHSHFDGTPYPEATCAMTATLRKGTAHTVALDFFWRKDGSSFPVQYTSCPVSEHGGVAGAVVTFKDLSEQLRLQTELQQRTEAWEEAEQAIRSRDQMLAVAAHELRTPITALLGYSQALQRRVEREGTLAGRDQQAMQMITGQATRLTRLINTLMDISRIHSDQLQLDTQPLDLSVLLKRAVAEAQATTDRHTIRCELPKKALQIEGDEARLEQVFQNLLQNAIKYSPHGGTITVIVRANAGGASVQVQDEGIGIPAEAIPHLFTHQYRAANVAESISGFGIGLYVVKEIVALHGGSVEVDSEPGVGSTFTVRLPRRQRPLVP